MNKSHQIVVDYGNLMEVELLLSVSEKIIPSEHLKQWLDKALEDVEEGKEGWEPEWETLPTWVVAVARDADGAWYLYRNIPYIVEPYLDSWCAIGSFDPYVFPHAPANLPWRQSLRLRRKE